MDKSFVKDCHTALQTMLDKDLIKFDKAPYSIWLDEVVKMNVFTSKVQFQTGSHTVEIDVEVA
tara:strand:- start:1682 stop:1870 length:189 start_codon:yes stop_codon:yes gene_type:complete